VTITTRHVGETCVEREFADASEVMRLVGAL